MASDTKNVKLGVCSIFFDGVDLGYTKGGVEVEVTTETKKVEVDQFGKSPINEIIMSRSVSAKVPLAETTLDNMVKIMPGATLVSDGSAASGTVTFSTAAPSANDTVTVNGVVFTFKASAPGANDVLIGSTFTDSAENFLQKFNASLDARIVDLKATRSAGVVTITSERKAAAYNAYTLAKSGTNIAVSGATLTGGVDRTKAKVDVTNAVGTSLLEAARKLVLHPLSLPASDKSEDFTIPLAMTPGALQFAYKLEDERIFNCTFTGYPDPVTKTLFIVGDETAV